MPAWSQRPLTETFTVDDGLPSAEIYDLEQDASGRLWILHRAGISAYDGHGFTHESSREGLPAGEMKALDLDADGDLWALTIAEGPKLYRRRGDGWVLGAAQSPALDSGSDATVFAWRYGERPLAVVGTSGAGLLLWDGAAWSAIRSSDRPAGQVSRDRITALVRFEATIAVGTTAGLCLLAGDALDCRLQEEEPRLADPLLGLFTQAPAAAGERLWILARDWLGRLEDGRLTVVFEHVGMPSRDVWIHGHLALDAFGGVVYGNEAQVFFAAPGARKPVPFGPDQGLAADGVTALLRDRESGLWIGGRRGLTRVGAYHLRSFDARAGLVEDEVSALAELSANRFVLGQNHGVTVLEVDPLRVVSTWHFPQSTVGSPGQYRVLDFERDAAGNVWMAANELGLWRLDPDGVARGPALLPQALAVAVDRDDRTWVVAGRQELLVGDVGGFTAVDPGVEGDEAFRWLTAAADGRLFLSTTCGLLWRDDGGWHRAHGPTPQSDVLYGVHVDPAGTVWVGTRAGLYRLQGGALVASAAPRVERPVYFALTDHDGRRWFGTDDGVFVLGAEGESLRHLSARDGLAGRETNRGAGLVDEQGRVWIGTDRGLSVYDRRFDRPRSEPPRLELSGIEVNGRPRPLDGAALALGAHESNLVFRYRTIALGHDEDVLVRFRLAGWDDDWQDAAAGAAEEVRYTNLPPGGYRFHVVAGWSESGLWSGEVVSPPIAVARPLWRRPWALAAALLGSLGLVAGVFALRTRTMRRHNRELGIWNAELERAAVERQRLIEELEGRNAELERFTYTVSHDLRTPLVTVRGFLGYLERDFETGDAARLRHDLAQIRQATERMGRLLAELLELSRIGRVVHPHETVRLADLAHEATAQLAVPIAARGVEVAIAPDLPAVVGDRARLLEVFENLIENAVKYMGDAERPRVEVGCRGGDGAATFVVADNGRGIDPRYQEKVFGLFERLDHDGDGTGVGLAIVKRIVEHHGGRIWVESEGEGRGSAFCFTLAAAPADGEGGTTGG